MIRTPLFQPAHLDLMDMTPEDAEAVKINRNLFTEASKSGGVITVLYNGRILYIAGHYELHDGCHEVFLIPSVYMKEHAVIAHRSVKRWIQRIFDSEREVHRIQTLCIATEERSNWMISLDFVYEGLHRSYTKNGQNWVTWSILRDGIRG